MSFFKTDQILSFGRNLELEERRRYVMRGCKNLGKLRNTEAPQEMLCKCDFEEGE